MLVRDHGGVLQVLCGETELAEYSEVIALGDRIERQAARLPRHLGAALDGAEWTLDRYAAVVGCPVATITGVVVAIDAVFVRMTREPSGSWAPAVGPPHLEPVSTTALTRRPGRSIVNARSSRPGEHGGRREFDAMQEGDERLSGWRFTLDREHFVPPGNTDCTGRP